MELIIIIIVLIAVFSKGEKAKERNNKTGKNVWDQVDKGAGRLAKQLMGSNLGAQVTKGARDMEDIVNNIKRKNIRQAKGKEAASYQKDQEAWRKKQEAERRQRDAEEQRKRALEEKQKQLKEQERRQKLELQRKKEEERKKQQEIDQAFHEEELHKKVCVNEEKAYAFHLDDYLLPTTAPFYPDVDDYLSPTTASFYPDVDFSTFSLQNKADML